MVDATSEYNNYPFKLNLSLLNHFRTFQNDNHEFPPNFVETVSYHVRAFKLSNPLFLKIEEKLRTDDSPSLEHLILIIHFYFGSIANLDEFVKATGSALSVASLAKSHINKTNILNIHAIVDCLRKLNEASLKKIEVLSNINRSEGLKGFAGNLGAKERTARELQFCPHSLARRQETHIRQQGQQSPGLGPRTGTLIPIFLLL